MEKTTAKMYIDITDLWENTPKSVMIDNIEMFLGYSTASRGRKNNTRLKELEKITDSNKYTVSAWMNRSRDNVKVPLLKLCKIAEHLGVTVEELLSPDAVNNRDWDGYDISVRQVRLFKKLNESKYFQDGKWDVQKLIRDMDIEGNYSKDSRESKLMEDCLLFFKSIFRVENGVFIDNVKKNIEDYLKEEVCMTP